ncbi:MAG: hypothetical protein WD766_12010 [Gemmatimonadota bacterium]
MPSVFRILTENWKLKVLAFALAVLLWVVISAEQVASNWIRVPLQVQVTDPSYQIASDDLPAEVEVLFTGARSDLFDLGLRRPPLRLTVAEVREPVENRSLDPRMVQIPAQLTVNPLEVRPSSVRLEFTQMQTRSVPVEVRISNELGGEWAIVDSIVSDPPMIQVRGPVERVANAGPIPTEVVDLELGDTTFSRVVQLDTAQVQGLELSTSNVVVSGRFDRVVERRIENVTVDVGPGITILPQEVDVVLRGPRRAVQEVAPGFFRVVVSIGEIPARIPADGVPVPLRIDGLRPDVLATVEPAAVRLFPATPQLDSLFTPGLAPAPDTLSVPSVDDQ